MPILTLKTEKKTLNLFRYQFIIEILIPISHIDLVYFNKIENYHQMLYVITKNTGKNKNKDNINT